MISQPFDSANAKICDGVHDVAVAQQEGSGLRGPIPMARPKLQLERDSLLQDFVPMSSSRFHNGESILRITDGPHLQEPAFAFNQAWILPAQRPQSSEIQS